MKSFLTSGRRMEVLLIFVFAIFFTSCTGCPDLCSCDDVTKMVNCSNLNLTSVPRDIPSDTQTLNLTNNCIVSLNSSDFENLTKLSTMDLTSNLITSIANETFANLPNLTELSLKENAIKSINGETFKGAAQLEVLLLTNNIEMSVQPSSFQNIPLLRILNLHGTTFVENYDFSNLPNLEILTVSNCSLNRLDPTHFEAMGELNVFSAHHNFINDIAFIKQIPSLEEIVLDDNQITEVPPRAFEMNGKLETIDMRRNKIVSLASKSLIGLKDNANVHLNDNEIETFPNDTLFGNETIRVYLDGNPINCNQDMKWMTSFLHKDIFESATCSSPDCIKGRDVTTLASCEFDCNDTESTDNKGGLIIALSVTSTLLILLCGFVCVTTYRRCRSQSRYATLNELSFSSETPEVVIT